MSKQWKDVQIALLKEFPERSPVPLEQFIGEDWDVFDISFAYGEELRPPRECSSRFWLGLLITGRAEIYELSSVFESHGTYRPVRILAPGDTFGLFALTEAILSGSKSRLLPKEAWRVSAGHISTLIAHEGECDGPSPNKGTRKKERPQYTEALCSAIHEMFITEHYPQKKRQLDATGKDHFLFGFFPHMVNYNYANKTNQKHKSAARVLFIVFRSLAQVTSCNGFSKLIHSQAIQELYPYRLCRNSFSDRFYTLLSQSVLNSREVRVTKQLKPIAATTIYYNFIEGVAQAIDAFLHQDPLFYRHRWDWESDQYIVEGEYQDVWSKDILLADHPWRKPKSEAFYPIGIANFHVNQRLSYRPTNKGAASIGDITEILCPVKETEGFLKFADYARVTIKEYFRLYTELLKYRSPETNLDAISLQENRISVATNLWGAGGRAPSRRVLALKFAPES